MDVNSPETWRWIWLLAAVVFALGEIGTPRAFFFLPFALGATLGAAAAFAGAGLPLEWLVFVVVSASVFGALWPIGRRLERSSGTHAIGANRWAGREAFVIEDIPAAVGATGTVRLDREKWRAESAVRVPIPAGSTVLVSRVDGTRLVVLPLELPSPIDHPPSPGPD